MDSVHIQTKGKPMLSVRSGLKTTPNPVDTFIDAHTAVLEQDHHEPIHSPRQGFVSNNCRLARDKQDCSDQGCDQDLADVFSEIKRHNGRQG